MIKIQVFAHSLYLVTLFCVNVSKISVSSQIICKKTHENLREEIFFLSLVLKYFDSPSDRK